MSARGERRSKNSDQKAQHRTTLLQFALSMKKENVGAANVSYRVAPRKSGDERAADARASLRRRLLPNGLQVHTHRGKNRNVQDGEQILGNFFLGIELDGHAAKSQVENSCAPSALFAKDSIGICAS